MWLNYTYEALLKICYLKMKTPSQGFVKYFQYLLFICFSFLLSLYPLIPDKYSLEKIYAEGEIEIYSIEDLNAVRGNLSGSYKLMNDLDFNDQSSWEDYETNHDIILNPTTGWLPIGNNSSRFSGIFDGQGYSISNIVINAPALSYVGLFGYIDTSGTVKNLDLVGVSITGYDYTGAIAGRNMGGILDCSVTGTISGKRYYTGGITGYSAGTVSGCEVLNSTITSLSNYLGGIVGYLYSGTGSTISNSHVLGTSISGTNYIGGILGYANSSSPVIVSNSYFVGTIVGTLSSIDGLIANRDSFYDRVINSFYSFEETTINGTNKFNVGALEKKYFDIWVANNLLPLDPGDYFDQEGEYYLIKNLEDFEEIRAFGSEMTLKFKLTTDLDFSSASGLYIPVFGGKFYGEGHEISNLVLNMPTTDYVGLFGRLFGDGYVESLYVTNANVTGAKYVGGVFGTGYDFQNIAFSGSVSGTPSYIGYIFGNTFISAEVLYAFNSFYDFDNSTLNGIQTFTVQALDTEVFNDWLENDYTFPDLSYYFLQDGEFYLINSNADFNTLRSFGRDSKLKFRLNTDLDFDSETDLYIPVFRGEFDGNGKTISNFTLNVSGRDNLGLFGEVFEGAKIYNLSVLNASVTGASNVGGLVGTNNGFISAINISGIISGTSQVGGLIGTNNGLILSSNTTGTVSGTINVGGLAGHNSTLSNKDAAEVRNSVSTANVNATNSRAGGLVGYNSSKSIITGCYSTGTVTATSQYAGGLVGENNYGKIINSYSLSPVTGDTYPGGLVGNNFGGTIENSFSAGSVTGRLYKNGLAYSGTATNSFWDTQTSGMATSGVGIGRTTAQMFDIATYANASWDISDIADSTLSTWKIENNMGYPELPNAGVNKHSLLTEVLTKDGEYYLITSLEDLLWVTDNILDIYFYNFKLTTDIDLTSSPSTHFVKFQGEFDGDGHQISNLTLNLPSENNVGFFGELLPGSIVKNLDLNNVNVVGLNQVGALVGTSTEGTIENCSSSGNVTGSYEVGGLVGAYEYGEIRDSHSTANVTSDDYEVGGLVGYIYYGTIDNCYWEGGTVQGDYDVGGLAGYQRAGIISNSHSSGSVSGESQVGGLVGTSSQDYDPNIIRNCYSSALVTGGSDSVGGLVGLFGVELGILENSYATGDVLSISGSSAIGGLVGYLEGGTVRKSFATGNVVGDDEVGGLLGSAEGNIYDSYAAGDVTEVEGGYEDGYFIGGLIGNYSGGEIHNSYSVGIVTAFDVYAVGGFIGESYASLTVNSFWDLESSLMTVSAGGTGKTTAQMKSIETYNDTSTEGLDEAWDISSIQAFNSSNPKTWYIESGNDYPRLFYQYPGWEGGGDEEAPVVATSWATDITSTSATLNGTLNSLGTYGTVSVYFRYRPVGQEEWQESPLIDRSIPGSFSLTLTAFSPDTQYEYSAVVSYGDSGILYGENVLFSTDPTDDDSEDITPPTLDDGGTNVKGITTEIATLEGYLKSLGSVGFVNVYFQYREENGIWKSTAKEIKYAPGSFTKGIQGLNPKSMYEFRPVVEFNDGVTIFGSPKSFSTLQLDIPSDSSQERLGILPREEEEEPEQYIPEEEVLEPETEEEIEEQKGEDKKFVTPLFEGIVLMADNAVEAISNVNISGTSAQYVAAVGYTFATLLSFIAPFVWNNSVSMLQLMSFFFVFGTLKKKKRYKYGVVYDSITKEPVNVAVVRVFDEQNRLITTAVTNVYGIFDIDIPDGKYRFEVVSGDYSFPSKAVIGSEDLPYHNIYRGGDINYSSGEISIPIDKKDKGFIAKIFASGRSLFHSIINLLLRVLFVAGFLMAIIAVVKASTTFSWIIIILYLLSLLVMLYINIRDRRSYGKVTDRNGEPLEALELGLKELEFGTLYTKRVTDEDGKYRFILPEGEYRLEVLNSNYTLRGSIDTTIKVAKGKIKILNRDIVLERV